MPRDSRSLPAVVEVPDDLEPRLRVSLAVDLVHGERLPRGVVLEAAVGSETGLATISLGGFLVDRRGRVVAEWRTDLQLHAFVEDEVAVRPELGRQVGAEPLHPIVGDYLALMDAAGDHVLLRDGRSHQQKTERYLHDGRAQTPHRPSSNISDIAKLV
jgi:hypothetical protein